MNELAEFYALAVIFGVAYGGGMPLYASLARDYFGQHIMGTVFGAATMLSSLGMAIGPVAGGWVFDTFGNYAWLYIASAAVAVGAVLLALLFPKPVSPPAATARPRPDEARLRDISARPFSFSNSAYTVRIS